MLLYLLSRVVSAACAFLYPTYASYKTLSRRPASEAELERWLMYWSVLGTLLAIEYTAEWTVSWIPFYYPLKTLFFLYLALPQTQGASYIYRTQLGPRLAAREEEIDAAIQKAREAGLKWAQRRLQELWTQFANISTGASDGFSDVQPMEEVPGATTSVRPATLWEKGSGPINIAYGLWRTYAPALATFVQPPLPPPAAVPHPRGSPPTSPVSPTIQETTRTSALEDTRSLVARRRALEAELASLPLPPPSPPLERVASSTYLPVNGDDRGRYEEIGRDEEDTSSGNDTGGDTEDRPPGGQRSTWWWGRGDGYERVKND